MSCNGVCLFEVVYNFNCKPKYRLHGHLKVQLQGHLHSCEKCLQALLCQCVTIYHCGSDRSIFLKLGIGDFYDNLSSNCKLG